MSSIKWDASFQSRATQSRAPSEGAGDLHRHRPTQHGDENLGPVHHILQHPRAHQNYMHKSLVQRGCEVAKAVNAFAVAQGFGQGGPKGERCRPAQACSQAELAHC